MAGTAARVGDLARANLPPSTAKLLREPILGWSNGYASFSEEFVGSVLDCLGVAQHHFVLDPMAGTGTVLLEAQRRGARCVVADMNPLAALLNCFRGAAVLGQRRPLLARCRRFADRLATIESALPSVESRAKGWFSDRQLALLKQIRDLLRLDINDLRRLCFIAPGETPHHFRDWFVLAGLALAASHFGLYVGSSNRTWLKPGGVDTAASVAEHFLRTTEAMLTSIDAAYGGAGASTRYAPPYASVWCSALSLPLADASVDVVVTSPPYPNRMDYLQMTGPGLQLLAEVVDLNLEALDEQMIATNKVKHLTPDRLVLRNLRGHDGSYVKELLTQIKDDVQPDGRPAHGGRTYYYPYFASYFASMQRCIREAARVTRRDGAIIMVVQDSFRRQAHIEMNRVVSALARAEGLHPEIVAQHHLRKYFGRIRPGVYGNPRRQFQVEHTLALTHR